MGDYQMNTPNSPKDISQKITNLEEKLDKGIQFIEAQMKESREEIQTKIEEIKARKNNE